MKSIKKITNKVTDNFSALAGSALLVGATLTGGAALASASSHNSGSSGNSMDLGDYPMPFVTEDGEVPTSIVLGSDAAVTDVVGATEIAGSLGNSAFEQQPVSVSGGASFTWSAMNGATLDTQNDKLYFGDQLNKVRQTLTEDSLSVLEEATFTDNNNDDTDITSFLDIGAQGVTFSNAADEFESDDDPMVHVEVPAESSVDDQNFLYNLQASFEDSIDFTDSDVAGEDIMLFGKEYTIAQENEGGNSGELLLYGSSQEVEVNSGSSTTVTINDEEVTIEVVSVNDGSTDGDNGNAAVRINGKLESTEKGDEIPAAGQEIRIDEIVKTGGSDSSSGVVNFQIGSQELTLQDESAIQDSEGDDIEGSYVQFNGQQTTNAISSISNIDVYVGAEDDDEDALMGEETFTHSAFPGIEVHFGGLNPDVTDEDTSASTVQFGTNGDDTATISYTTNSGDDVTMGFANGAPTPANTDLANDDGDVINVFEGNRVEEDDYFTADAGDFSRMFEVTNVDVDGQDTTVDIRQAGSGDQMEVELDQNSNAPYQGREIIDGKEYYFDLNSNEELMVTWGDGASAGNVGDTYSLYPALDTQSGAAVAPTQHGFGSLLDAPETSGTASISQENVNGNVVTHNSTATVDSQTAGSSLDGFTVDYTGADEDVDASNTTTSNVSAVTLNGNDVSGNLTGVDSSNNGDTVTFQFDGPNNLQDGDELSVVYNVTDSSTGSTTASEFDINPQSSGASYDGSGNLTSTNSQVFELPTTESTDEAQVKVSIAADGTVSATAQTSGVQVMDAPSSVLNVYNSAKVVQVNGGAKYVFHNAQQDALRSSSTDQADLQTHVLGSDSDTEANHFAPRSMVVLEPEDDSDDENAYVVAPGYESDEDRVSYRDGSGVVDPTISGGQIQSVDPLAGEIAYPDGTQTDTMESNDDVTSGYDIYGTYSEVDEDEQGSFQLWIPSGQASVGAAVTGTDGSLNMGGGGGSAMASMPTYQFADGVLASDGNIDQVKNNDNVILVGGPAANSLTQELVQDNQTMPAGDYTEGQGMIQLVDGFSEGNHALVVAGQMGEDTRAAAEFLADYRNNEDALEGEGEVMIETSSGTVVQ